MFELEQFGPQINNRNSGRTLKNFNHTNSKMNLHYKSPSFQAGAPQRSAEPGSCPLSETRVLEMNMSGGEQYGSFQQGHMGNLQQQQTTIHEFSKPQQPLNPSHHQHFGGNFGLDAGNSCLHSGRMLGYSDLGHQQGFAEGFNLFSDGQSADVFSQHEQRTSSVADFQHHGRPGGNHPATTSCLPMDQSPNRPVPFHRLSSSESHNLESRRLRPPMGVDGLDYSYSNESLSDNFEGSVYSLSESDSRHPHFGPGRQVQAPNFNENTGLPHASGMHVISKEHPHTPLQQQQSSGQHIGAFIEHFVGGRKIPQRVDPGARHALMPQQQPGLIGRQNTCPPTLPHPQQSESGLASMDEGGIMMPGQHNQYEYAVQRSETHRMHNYDNPMFNIHQQPVPPQQPRNQRLQHFDSSYLNVTKRPRFDFPNASHGRENHGTWNSDIHPSGGEKNLTSVPYPSLPGEFTSPLIDSFSSNPSLQLGGPEQQQQNAALMIKQMASRSQQQRLRQPNLQQLGQHHDLSQGPLRHRESVGGMCQSRFERESGGRIINFDGRSPHITMESGWLSEPHPPGEIIGNCIGSGGEVRDNELQQTGPEMYRPGGNGLGIPESMRILGEGHVQPLLSPNLHSQYQNGVGNLSQMQSPSTGVGLTNTAAERCPNDFPEPPRGSSSFPFAPSNRQGGSSANSQGLSPSPGTRQTDFPTSQRSSASKLGGISLGNFSKSNGKDNVFGQSCLAALSTACQNMIASLGAPNLNVTFNKKTQGEGKRKLSQNEQDLNSSVVNGTGNSGIEYFPGINVAQNGQIPPAGSNNTKPSSQVMQGEARALSPNYNMDSTLCSEGKSATGSGRGRGRRKIDSGHLSPGMFFSSESISPVASPSQHVASAAGGGERRTVTTQEKTLTSPIWGKGGDVLQGDHSDLLASLENGTQSSSKSGICSPHIDLKEDKAIQYRNEDEVSSSTDHQSSMNPGRSSLLSLQRDNGAKSGHKGQGSLNTTTSTSDGHPGTPGTEQAASSTSGQEEIHPLEILQAQIQLQRQQFSISEDQPLASKKNMLSSDCSDDGEFGNCGSDAEKNSMASIDLDTLMAEQHANWYVPNDKPLLKTTEEERTLWEEGVIKDDIEISQSKIKASIGSSTPAISLESSGSPGGMSSLIPFDGAESSVSTRGACSLGPTGDLGSPGPAGGVGSQIQRLSVHCTDELVDSKTHTAPVPSWRALHSDISNRFGTFVAALTLVKVYRHYSFHIQN
ncbi:hypothetical protein DNTS_005442 [Danionella cerebrum]|uniref:Uncharacterized protein n=1 Tax=Danionella cerebrum TaxID=2873325 RepID=A0A553RFI1_9TELE|nr:hypothetical protein DNTS_005442 [Danionella translucida]